MLDESGRALGQQEGTGHPPLARIYEVHLAGKLSKIAVAIGPGSFTGTRVGVSFGLGLAIGLGVPIVPLPSLDLQAARCDLPVTAVTDAGRGRLYFQVPGGKPTLGDPSEVPTDHPLVGWYPVKTDTALRDTGHTILVESEIPRSFAEAAAELLKSAREVPYGSVKLEYVQYFGGSSKS